MCLKHRTIVNETNKRGNKKMKVTLNVFERINLLSILPREGDFTTLKLIRKTREDLSFTEEEHKLLKFKNLPDGRVTWNAKATKDCVKEFEIGEVVTIQIKDTLMKLDSQKRLKDEHFTLYEKFCLTKEN